MNLKQRLKNASHLARCDAAIRKLLNNKPLETGEKSWVFNLFVIGYYDSYQEDQGTIAQLLVGKNNPDYKLFTICQQLSHKIMEEIELIDSEWNFILDGLVLYRRDLISQSSSCSCD